MHPCTSPGVISGWQELLSAPGYAPGLTADETLL